MRKFVGMLVLVTMLVGLVALVGCEADDEGVISTPVGDIEFVDGKIIVVNEEGDETTWTVSSASEQALGFPVPENVTLEKGSIAVVASEGAPDQKWTGATFWSEQTIEDLVTWYRGELETMAGFSDTSTELDGQQVGLFSIFEGGTRKSVVITPGMPKDPGKSKIVVGIAEGI